MGLHAEELEKYLHTSTIEVEQYKNGSRLSWHCTVPRSGRNKAARLGSGDLGDAEDDDDDSASTATSTRWEDKGADFVEVLSKHLRNKVLLPIKYQELLLHMVLNADNHASQVSLATAALKLLEANVRMHPPSKQDAERPHILMLNRNAAGKDNLWLPHEELRYEQCCYTAVCGCTGTSSKSKLTFLHGLLRGGEQVVLRQLSPDVQRQRQQQQQQQQQQLGPSTSAKPPDKKDAGPMGRCLALRYVTQLLLDDFEERMKVYKDFGPKMVPETKKGLKGDLDAAKRLLRESLLAKMLQDIGEVGWSTALASVVHSLVGLILDTAPADVVGPPKDCPPGSSKKNKKPSQEPKASQGASGSSSGGSAATSCSPACEAVSAGEVGRLARRLLRSIYDLTLILEEERLLLNNRDNAWIAKHTDCRQLAIISHEVLTRPTSVIHSNPLLSAQLEDPCAKAELLSALSPSARLHLLSFIYAHASARRWANVTVIPPQLQYLQPLKDYAEGNTSVRAICSDGPPRADPVELLCDLELPANFKQSRLGLMGVNGKGCLTWITSFASAAVLAAREGAIQVDLASLKGIFEKVVARVEQDGISMDGLHDRLCLAAARKLLRAC